MRLAPPRPALALAILLALAFAAGCNDGDRDETSAFTAAAPKPAGPPATLHVRARGSDGGDGSAGRPYRTVDRAVRAAGPGDTIVLGPGRYGRRGETLRIRASGRRGRPLTIRGRLRGRSPRLLGQVRVEGDYVHLRGLLFDGPTGAVDERSVDNPGGEDVQVWIRAAHVTLADSEVRGNLWHAGVFVTADDARVLRNRVHDNGDRSDPDRATLDHGIYWSSGSGGVIAGNLVERNVGFGIQLYPDAHDVRVVENTLVGNGGAGVVLAGATSDTTVARNIVAFNGDPRVTVDLQGTGNRLTDNLFWENGAAALDATDGLGEERNRVEDPADAPSGLGAAGLDSNIR